MGIEIVVPDPAATAAAYASVLGVVVQPGPGPIPGEHEVRIGEHGIRLVPPPGDGSRRPSRLARVAIAGTAGERVLRDLLGVRFARL